MSTVRYMFERGDAVRHRKGGVYVVVHTPDECRIEAGNVPAYMYRPLGELEPLWVRPQSEMEDGRFKLNDKGYAR